MHNVGMFYLWIAVILTIWSGIDYLWKFVRVFAIRPFLISPLTGVDKK